MNYLAPGSFKGILSVLLLIALLNLPSNAQWTAQVSGTQYPLHSVYFINNSTGLLISNSTLPNQFNFLGGEIIRTTNGGNNWETVLLDSNLRAKGFYFFDSNTGFIVGGSYATRGYFYKTTNGGLNWVDVTPNPFPPHLFNLTFLNNNTGYAAGNFGVLKSTDSGTNWITVLNANGAYPSWGKIHFVDVNTGFYIHDTGMVFKTTNGGLNWTSSQIALSPNFRDIKFLNNNTGIIVGTGMIFKTTNQGNTWLVVNSIVAQDFFSVFFADINTGYITAEHTVLKTTNSGNSWFSVFSEPADTIFSAYFINSETGYVCGDEGRVYKTTSGGVLGINPISNQVPKEFMLYQNYPNPFNPNTNIQFAIAKASNVKLTIFDAIGREVETLVNEYVSPGTYEVKWDAARFSSGIYFYKIVTNDYTMAKRMSLIK